MQAYAACSDPDVQALVRRRFDGLFRLVEERSEATDEVVRDFFAHGMLINVAASMDLASLQDKEWVERCFGPVDMTRLSADPLEPGSHQ
jgi:hypothetical protein